MSIVKERRWRRVSVAFLVILSGTLTASFRFLAINFNDDHFVHLTAAQQMFFGDWPTRDFVDVGRPLQIVASAVAQGLLGHTLFAEAVLISAAFGVAAALTAAIVFKLTGSLGVSFGAVLVEVAAFPRTYHYPKLLATAAGVWLIGYFLRRPSFVRQILMAAGVAIAFLFRHDLGLFVGVGGLVASILAAPTAPWRVRLRSGTTFAALVLAMVAPYIAYVHLNGGLWNHVVTALDQMGGQDYTWWPNPLARGDAWDFQLFYVFHLLPLAAMGVFAMASKRSWDHWSTRFLISLAVVAVAENFGLIRHPFRERIPDAIVPAVVLGAWLLHRAWLARPRYLLIPSAVVLVGAGFAIGDAGNVGDNLDRAGLTGEIWLEPELLPVRFAERSAQLHERFGSDSPSRTASTLRPFFSYLDRCTTEQHRLFLGGMIPEVAYLARRPFAGGAYEHYNFSSRINQQRVVDRLRGHLVPFALIPSGSAEELEDLPIVASYLRERYVQLADLLVAGDDRIRILIDDKLPSTSRDAETGWPCFR